MAMDREKEREMELESAMYTNCLLLGLDPDIIGVGPNDAIPRAGLFRHSNPKLGKQLLYFILSSLRGPIQSAKDFDNVWPILDSAQSRNFQKVVQGIISELESQGVLPRSDSGVSSVVICCGPRFVELLWQLSVHALREVHMRTFAADVALTPLPAPLTDVAFSLADTLLPVTKARIALERRRFLKNAETTVQRQALWSNLALEMTAEFRGLCAEEAYLQQELEKLHHLRNKVKLGGDLWDELVSSSSQNARTVQRATRLWDSLSSCKSQYDVLASGPIKDHIAHREHRFQISGSSLLAAMDQSSLVPFTHSTPQNLDNEEIEGPQADVKKESKSMLDSSLTRGTEENNFQVDERNTRRQPTVDIAEVFRRWTHALRHVHNQSVQLAKANNGEGPDLLRSVHDGGTSNHAESLAETLAEHRQHLKNIQVLLNQLNDVAPTIQNSISELMDEVISQSSNLNLRSNLPIQAHVTGRAMGIGNDDNVEIKRPSSLQLEKVSARPPTLKLPPLYSSTPNSSGKGRNMQKRQTEAQVIPVETITEKKSLEQPPSTGHMNNQHDEDIYFLQNLKKSVRAAALSSQLCNLESSQDSHSDDSSEHFFIRLSRTGFSYPGQDKKLDSLKSRQLFTSQKDSSLFQMHAKDFHLVSKYRVAADVSNNSNSLDEYDGVNDFLSAVGSNSPVSDAYGTFIDMDEAQDQVSSPPLLMDAAILEDSYEDLLGYRLERHAEKIGAESSLLYRPSI